MKDERPRWWVLTGAIDDLSPADRSLILGALDLLAQAELEDVVNALSRGVLAAAPDDAPDADADAMDARLVAADGRLQPFAELLFCELRWIAVAPGWSTEMRSSRAIEAIILAGF